MARNKKEEQKKANISARLDPDTRKLWDTACKSNNMSEWLRIQLLYHFGAHRTREHELAKLQEEIRQLRKQYSELQLKFEGEIAWRVRRYKELNNQPTQEEDDLYVG